ncbi:MAG: molybdenum cofactor synthesis domain-containing protein [Halobacteriales archaeon]
MEVFDTDEVGAFDAEAFRKVNLFETPDLFVDCYCFEPDQRQAPHRHADADKLYLVLEGRATVTVGDESRELGPGEIALAPRGEPHGIANEGEARMRALVMMAPLPTADGGHHHDHVEHRPREVAVVTVSSSRHPDEDVAGDRIRAILRDEGHRIVASAMVHDDVETIRQVVRDAVEAAEAVVVTGGTGITPDDVTIEAVRPMFAKELDGFGEHFRRLSVAEIDTAVIMTRATAGVVARTPVFALPGSPDAVGLGVREAILPELDHVVDLAAR